MSDVFISYARDDRALAQALADDLSRRGFRVWWDVELVGADDFHDVILEALGKAKAAVVIWSKSSVKSKFVRDEARFALHYNKLVAVRTPDLDVLEIPFGFQGQHTDNVADREQIVRAVIKLGVQPVESNSAATPSKRRRIDDCGTVDELMEFIEANPPEAERREAFARLRMLLAKPRVAAGDTRGVRSALRMSNLSAFLSGLTLRVPAFQLSSQGVWSSIGTAFGYFALQLAGAAIVLKSYASFRGSQGGVNTIFLVVATIALAALARVAWTRYAAMVEQRNFVAATIMGLIFLLQAWLALVFAGVGLLAELDLRDEMGFILFWALIAGLIKTTLVVTRKARSVR